MLRYPYLKKPLALTTDTFSDNERELLAIVGIENPWKLSSLCATTKCFRIPSTTNFWCFGQKSGNMSIETIHNEESSTNTIERTNKLF